MFGVSQTPIIRLRQKENVESSKNYLIAMLEELLKKGDKEKKKKNLSSNFGLIMTEETIRRIDHMCNLSDLIVEQGIEQGMAQGMERGMAQGIELKYTP